MAEADDLAAVVQLEQRLLDPGVRSTPEQTRELLHPDYVEFGATGRVWDRDSITAALIADPQVSGPGAGFSPVRLAEDVIVLTYRIQGERGSLRSSIWVRGRSGWQVRFHQGTRVRSPG